MAQKAHKSTQNEASAPLSNPNSLKKAEVKQNDLIAISIAATSNSLPAGLGFHQEGRAGRTSLP
jgi:hypothetical protein